MIHKVCEAENNWYEIERKKSRGKTEEIIIKEMNLTDS